jgi:hypothetical protein
MSSSNSRSIYGRVQRLEALPLGVCQTCRAHEAMSHEARDQRSNELTAKYLEMSPDQIGAVIATLRAMTAAEIQAWVTARQGGEAGSMRPQA